MVLSYINGFVILQSVYSAWGLAAPSPDGSVLLIQQSAVKLQRLEREENGVEKDRMAYWVQKTQWLFGHQWLLAHMRLSIDERLIGPRDPMCRALFVLASLLFVRFAYQRWSAKAKGIGSASGKPTAELKVALEPETRSAGEDYFMPKTRGEQPMHGFSHVLDQVLPKPPITEPRQPLADESAYKVTKATDLARFGVALQTKVVTMMPAGDESAALVMSMFGRYAVYLLSYNKTREEVTVALERLGIKIILTTSENVERLGTMPEGVLLLVVKASSDSVGEFQISAAMTK